MPTQMRTGVDICRIARAGEPGNAAGLPLTITDSAAARGRVAAARKEATRICRGGNTTTVEYMTIHTPTQLTPNSNWRLVYVVLPAPAVGRDAQGRHHQEDPRQPGELDARTAATAAVGGEQGVADRDGGHHAVEQRRQLKMPDRRQRGEPGGDERDQVRRRVRQRRRRQGAQGARLGFAIQFGEPGRAAGRIRFGPAPDVDE